MEDTALVVVIIIVLLVAMAIVLTMSSGAAGRGRSVAGRGLVCPQAGCGHVNRQSATYCARCGAKLSSR